VDNGPGVTSAPFGILLSRGARLETESTDRVRTHVPAAVWSARRDGDRRAGSGDVGSDRLATPNEEEEAEHGDGVWVVQVLAGLAIQIVKLGRSGKTHPDDLRPHGSYQIEPVRAPGVSRREHLRADVNLDVVQTAAAKSSGTFRPIIGSAPFRGNATANSSWIRLQA
jgi:hypothetical protein